MARVGSFDEYETFERIPRRKRKGTIDLTDKVCEKLAMAQAQRSLGGCRKISFYNKAAAERAMARFNSNAPGESNPRLRNTYRCHRCGQWHLTSMSKSESVKLREIRARHDCGKTVYVSRESALAALPAKNANRSSSSPYIGTYKCPMCGGFHLIWKAQQ